MQQRMNNLLSNAKAALGYSNFEAMLFMAVLAYFALAIADMTGLKG